MYYKHKKMKLNNAHFMNLKISFWFNVRFCDYFANMQNSVKLKVNFCSSLCSMSN